MAFFVLMIICASSIFFSCVLSRKKSFIKKVIIRGYTIFWTFWILLSSLNIFDLYSVSAYTYFIIILGNLAFIFGASLVTGNKKTIENGSGVQKTIRKRPQFKYGKIINICLIVCIIYLAFICRKYYDIVARIGAVSARLDRFRIGLLFPNTISILFFNIIITGGMFVITILMAKYIIYRKILNVRFVLFVIYFLLFLLIGSGRLPILYLACFIFVFFILKVNEKKHEVKPTYNANQIKSGFSTYSTNEALSSVLKGLTKYLIIIFIVALGLALYFSSLRSDGAFNLFDPIKSLIIYNIGSFRALDYGIDNIVSQTGFMFGRMTFSAVDEVIGYLIRLFGFNYDFSSRIQSVYTQLTFPIGTATTFNALYTWFFWFYWDFGIVGVVVIPFLIGVLVSKFLAKSNLSKIENQILFCYISYCIIFSPQKWVFLTISDLFPLLVILIFKLCQKFKKGFRVLTVRGL